MKKFVELIVAVKSHAAMMFAGAVMLYAVAGWMFGAGAIPFANIWQIMILSFVCSAWQFFCFYWEGHKKLRYHFRAVLFLVPMYALLSAFAYFGDWIPREPVAWIAFSAAFLAVAAILVGVYEVYFKITGVRLNKMLAAYKERQPDAKYE